MPVNAKGEVLLLPDEEALVPKTLMPDVGVSETDVVLEPGVVVVLLREVDVVDVGDVDLVDVGDVEVVEVGDVEVVEVGDVEVVEVGGVVLVPGTGKTCAHAPVAGSMVIEASA
jgi:hypothetical protein